MGRSWIKYRVGEYHSPGNPDPLLTLGDTRKLCVRMDVDERDIGKIARRRRVRVIADAFPGIKFPGTVLEVGRHVMGRKNIRTDDPTERIDTKILEDHRAGHPAQLFRLARVVSWFDLAGAGSYRRRYRDVRADPRSIAALE